LASALNSYGSKAFEFVIFVNSNGYDGVGFLTELPMIKEIYRDALPLYSSNSSLVKAVWGQVFRDNSINNKLNVASRALGLLYDSGIRSLDRYTIHVPGNYSAALLEGYPEADFEKAFEILLKDTKAADIRQIQILDMNGEFGYLPEKIDYKRAFWLLLSLLERIGEPQTIGEEVATRVAAYQYDLSEAGFSKQEIVEKALKLYQLVPKIGSRLVQNIQSEDERRIVEYYKAQAPLRLYDFKTKNYYDDKEAVEVFIKRLEEGYDGKILSAYPNGTVGPWNEDPRFRFYDWPDDRFHHGLANAVGQLLGSSNENIQKHLISIGEWHSFPEFLEMAGVKVDWENRRIIANTIYLAILIAVYSILIVNRASCLISFA